LHAQYYSQGASAGLIITEGTRISRDAVGRRDVLGIFNDAQVRAWCHFVQLWHTPARRRIGTSSTATARFRAFRLQQF